MSFNAHSDRPTKRSTSMPPVQISFPLPSAPHTTIHLHLTILTSCVLLFLTTATGESSGPCALGSFVYSMPDRTCSTNAIHTPLYVRESSLDFTTRIARILASRVGKPIYVGNSISLSSTGLGGTVEEEMESLGKVVELTLREIERASNGGTPLKSQ